MTFEKILDNIVSGLIDTWNQNDMDTFGEYMTDSVVVRSEHINKVHPNNISNEIIGKEEVLEYWSKLTTILPIKYDQYDLVTVGSKAEIVCHIVDSEKKSRLNLELDEYGKIKELHVQDFVPA